GGEQHLLDLLDDLRVDLLPADEERLEPPEEPLLLARLREALPQALDVAATRGRLLLRRGRRGRLLGPRRLLRRLGRDRGRRRVPRDGRLLVLLRLAGGLGLGRGLLGLGRGFLGLGRGARSLRLRGGGLRLLLFRQLPRLGLFLDLAPCL